MPVLCLRDQLAGFLNPFVATNEAVAERDFKILINDKTSKFYFSPQHFDLYVIGEFDSETGIIKKQEPTILVTGLSVKEKSDAV